jgi:predicted site-specific integrase-resolvase
MRIAIYVRVSTQRQAQTQTIDQQIDRLRAHLQAQGWPLPEGDIFRDDGYSGASLKRPGLDRLRDRAAMASFDKILITDPDRLARNYVHQVLLLEELQKHGCRVEFLDRPMSQDPHDRLLLQIRGAVAEYERTLIAERATNRSFSARNNKVGTYLLRSLVSCGGCGLACMARRLPPRNSYYVCTGKTRAARHRNGATCESRYIPSEAMDELVWQDLRDLLRHPEAVAEAFRLASVGAWHPQEFQARRDRLRQAKVSLAQQLERLTEAYLGGVIPLPEYERRRAEIGARDASLAEQQRRLSGEADRLNEALGLAASLEAFCERVSTGLEIATFDQKRQLVELLIDRVVVTGDEVEIRYVLPTSPQSEHVRFCVRREKARIFSGCNSRPATQSLQPVAIGAAVEVTKPPKPSMQRVASGDPASRQAVTRVNAEQASKRATWEPTRHKIGEGRRHWGTGGHTPRSDTNQWSHRGSGDGMPAHGDPTQHGKPRAVAAVTVNRGSARTGPGRTGWRTGP